MNDTMWYYAQDGSQHGPISEAELRSLIANGEVSPDDLVWKQGMPDWKPARELDRISGGQPSGDANPPPQPARPGPSRGERVGTAVTAVTAAAGWTAAAGRRVDSRWGVLLALLLMLLARGCDSIGRHAVSRLQAKATLAVSDFEDGYRRQRATLQRQRKRLQEEGGELEELDEVDTQLGKLQEEEDAERERLAAGSWLKLNSAAGQAQARYDAASYWRQWVLLLGAGILTVNLFGLLANPPDRGHRHLAVVLLAILLWSLLSAAGWS